MIFLVCTIGAVCNFLSFLVMVRHRVFKNSFGYLTAYHAISNTCILCIFIVWAVPWTVWNIPPSLFVLNLRIGQLSLFFVETAFHCSLFISINRLMAITYPMHYRRTFTARNTVAIIAFISLISGLYWGAYFTEGCDFFFDHKNAVWSFGSEPCSVWMSFYIDMIYNVVLFVAVGVIDIATFVQLKLKTKEISRRQVDGKQTKEAAMRDRKEFLFFVQATLNSSIYAFMLVCFHLISRVINTDLELFLCTTFVWGSSHAAGGIILIAFNPEIRRHCLQIRYISTSINHHPTMSNVRRVTVVPNAVD